MVSRLNLCRRASSRKTRIETLPPHLETVGQSSRRASSRKTRIETARESWPTARAHPVEERVPGKQGLKLYLLERIVEMLDSVEERVPGKQGLKLIECYLMDFRPVQCRRASSRKTRIETKDFEREIRLGFSRRASSRKTRIETSFLGPLCRPAWSRRASSRKTRIETFIGLNTLGNKTGSKSEFQENKD